MSRVLQERSHELDLLFDKEACIGWQEMRHPLGGGMCSVGCAEGIVHIDIAVGGKSLCIIRVVGLFVRVEAHILKKKHFASLEGLNLFLHLGADYIGSNLHRLSQKLGKPLSYRSHGELWILLSLWPSEVAHHNQGCPLLGKDILNGGQCSADTCVVLDHTLFQRNVEINPDKNSLSCQVCIADCI